MLMREYAIKWWFVIPRLLTSVSALPGEIRTLKSVFFQSCCILYLENKMSRQEIILHTVLNNTTYCRQKSYQNWLVHVEDIASQSSHFWVMVYSMTEKTISGVHVHVSPGSAKKLVRRGRITNHCLIAYSLSNISAKKYQYQLMCVEVIVCNISVIFLRHSVQLHVIKPKPSALYAIQPGNKSIL